VTASSVEFKDAPLVRAVARDSGFLVFAPRDAQTARQCRNRPPVPLLFG